MIQRPLDPEEGDADTQADEVTPIAIIGFAFEFAQDATTEDGFWQMIAEGRSASVEFPKDRLNIDAFYHSDASRTSTLPLRGGHFVTEDLGAFDAPFFSINPAEAACMDPQHRRMLETSYRALENAGIPLSKSCGSDTAVYTGCFTNDYLNMLQHDFESEQRHAAPGVGPSMLANRVSWFFDLKGPSMNLDSACSSSLIALHLACQDLRTKAASMALVGGANLIYHPELLKMFANFGFLGPDSRSWSFDERANGYARGEGTAVLVIKPLADALQDGDTIRAVIRNTGSNQDGRTPGITQPSQEAQRRLIEATYRRAGLSMKSTRFFEAHGTGTPTGDPIEASAIGKAFASSRSNSDPLYIGAVKANIGHLEGGSGLAGVIKSILVLEKGLIPPIAGLTTLNHRIDASELHLNFPTKLLSWPSSDLRRACVNSFGFGGSNATVILDDAYNYLKVRGLDGFHHTQTPHINSHDNTENEPDSIRISDDPPKLLVWSAADKATASHLGDSISRFAKNRSAEIADIAYTLAARRSHLAWRSFQVVDSPTAIDVDPEQAKLDLATPVKAINDGAIAFIFTGQGAQYLGMGRGLAIFPAFRESLKSQDECLQSIGCQWSVMEIIESKTLDLPIAQPQYSQLLTSSIQIALVDLFACLGIQASIVIGHSSGEIAAAYAAGMLSRWSAVKVAYWRGILSSNLSSEVSNQGMMAVGLSRDGVLPYLAKVKDETGTLEVFIGCSNSPKSVTLTGELSQLSMIETLCKQDSVFARKLKVPISYHSPFMQAMAGDYEKMMGELKGGSRTQQAIMISSVTGQITSAAEVCMPQYWVRNLTSTVEFDAAFSALLKMSHQSQRKQLGRKKTSPIKIRHILEIGPHSSLQGPIRDCLQAVDLEARPTYIPSLIRGSSQHGAILSALGKLHCAGYSVNLVEANHMGKTHRSIPNGMPQYPFNHEKAYWKEGRISRNHRLRKFARHDLLGTRALDWNPQVAQWRNTIRLKEMPWLEDHKVGGQTIFPGAGMLVMAVEAMRQLLNEDTIINGVQMQDVSFLRPITFSRDTGSAEVQLTLSVVPSLQKQEWTQFRLFKIEDDAYVECCVGSIRPVLATTDMQQTMNSAKFLGTQSLEQWTKSIARVCTRNAPDAYEALSRSMSNLEYGPSFKNIERMHVGIDNEAISELNERSWMSETLNVENQEFAIHPTTLDGLAQLVVLALSYGRHNQLPTMVPSRVENIWIDTRNTAGTRLNAVTKFRLRKGRGAIANIVATSSTSNLPLVCFDRLETALIDGSAQDTHTQQAEARNLCTQLIWKPDIELMSNKKIYNQCVHGRPTQPSDTVDEYHKLQLVIMTFIHEALDFVKDNHISIPDNHLQKHVGWMRYQEQRIKEGSLDVDPQAVQKLLQDDVSHQNLIHEIESSGVEGHFFMQLGKNLISMLRGDVNPLDLMFRDGLIDPYYETVLASEYIIHPLVQYVDLMSFKNPSMKILEIGAGTGGQTLRLLETMASNKAKKWERYDYTDVSPSFFARVQTKFENYSNLMKFQVLDISRDPVEQSFEAGSYDLILASQVLHATDNIGESLKNIKRLLKPSGKLVFGETTRPETLHINFAFGLLQGWLQPLMTESRSRFSPCLTTAEWDRRLRDAGFNGVDIEFQCQQYDECQYSSTLVASLASEYINGNAKSHSEIVILRNPHKEKQVEIASVLQHRLNTSNVYDLITLEQAQLADSTLVISLLEVQDVFLDSMTNSEYDSLKSVLLKDKNTLWVTKSTNGEVSQPQHHLAIGFGRTLASEDAARKFVTLTLDKILETPENIANAISAVSERVILSPVEAMETNYMATPDGLEICRVVAYAEMDKKIAKTNSDRHHQECELKSETRLVLRPHENDFGLLTDLEFSDLNIENESSSDANNVEIDVEAFGFSHRDSLMLSGQLDFDGNSFLTEGAGIIRHANPSSGLKPGDRVCFIIPRAAGTQVSADIKSVFRIPDGMDFVTAATLPIALWLAYHALINIGRLQAGESVLIHRASSSLGQIAIQLAISAGATVYVTTTSKSKRDLLLRQFELPEQNILDLHDSSLLDKFRETIGCEGVDIIMGSIGLDHEIDLARYLAPFGRLVDTGLYSKARSSRLSHSEDLGQNVMKASIDMAQLFNQKPAMAYGIFQKAMKHGMEMHVLPPQAVHTFEANELQQALQHLRDPTKSGKRVVKLTSNTKVIANIETKATYSFSANATYVIAGGLGGLGRSIAKWMVKRGARHLALLSRSGPRTQEAKDLIHELEQQGARCATPLTDISNLDSLKKTLDRLRQDGMPPIKGCVQATVTLRDNVFENMSYDDWTISTSSKVTGSWNLHQAMPSSDLDFFVLISSIGGIYGSRGQANYAAGNTFKDAVARYRVEKGLKAISIDLGVMIETGVVAESDFLLGFMRRIGFLMDIVTEEFLALMDHYCDPSLPILSPAASQIVVGLELPANMLSRGLDLHHAIFRPMTSHLFHMKTEEQEARAGNGGSGTVDRGAQLAQASSTAEAVDLVTGWLLWKLGLMLGMAEADIDVNQPIYAYGIDSLISIDLKNWLLKEVGADITVFELLGQRPLKGLSEMVVERSRYRKSA